MQILPPVAFDEPTVTRHDDTRVRDAIEAWGLAVLLDLHGMGWPRVATIGRLMEEGPTGAAIRPAPGPRTLRVRVHGWYWCVERVLAGLGPGHRLIASAEAGLLNGKIRPNAGMAERAAVLGVSRHAYRKHLRVLRRHVRWELDRRPWW